jgi:hypothetical protein
MDRGSWEIGHRRLGIRMRYQMDVTPSRRARAGTRPDALHSRDLRRTDLPQVGAGACRLLNVGGRRRVSKRPLPENII